MVTPTPRFNSLLTQFDSKGAILTRGVAALMQSALARIPADDIVIIAVDKQGGRNRYAAMLQYAFPEAWVSVELESAAESRYRLEGLKRKVTVVFRPRAEAEHMSVAVASMFSKYIRELMMDQFNRFWTAKLPGLAPTAGYPVDAKRFMAAIQPVLKTLEIDESTVWRRK
jgi:ribonuclease HIII